MARMSILCICTGNTCRSPMLAALLRHYLDQAGRDEPVESAGLAACRGAPASAAAQACMRSLGLDLSDHRSKPVDAALLQAATHILALGPRHAAALREAGVVPTRLTIVNEAGGGIPDPFGGDGETYRQCAAVLDSWARTWVATVG